MDEAHSAVAQADAGGGSPGLAQRTPQGRPAATSDLNDDAFMEAATSRYYLHDDDDNDDPCCSNILNIFKPQARQEGLNEGLLRTPSYVRDSPVSTCCSSFRSRKKRSISERHTLPRLSSNLLISSRQTPNGSTRMSSPASPRQRASSNHGGENPTVSGTPQRIRPSDRSTQIEVVRKIVMLGARSSGKSSVVHRFAQKRFGASYDPTIESTIRAKVIIKGITFLCDVIDTAGQDEYSTFSRQATVGVHGYCMVFSVTSMQSFQAIQKIYERITELVGSYTVPIVLVGTKSDDETHREVPTAAGDALAESWGATYVECSAKSDFGIDDVFVTLMYEVERDSGLLVAKDSDDSGEPSNSRGCTIS